MTGAVAALPATSGSAKSFIDLDVSPWWWLALLAAIVALLLVDLLVVHREGHEVHTREAAIESAA
ncbi:MAG: hypothetical protein RJB61_2380, partial [Actinomycetota bacterium]